MFMLELVVCRVIINPAVPSLGNDSLVLLRMLTSQLINPPSSSKMADACFQNRITKLSDTTAAADAITAAAAAEAKVH